MFGNSGTGAAQSTSISDSETSAKPSLKVSWWKFGVNPVGDVR